MAESECVLGVSTGSCIPQCTPDEECDNREQQTTEIEMLQSIFERQFVLLNSAEYMVINQWFALASCGKQPI